MRSKAVLPWLFPLILVVGVLAATLLPSVVDAVLAGVAFILLGFVGVPLVYRLQQSRGDGGGAS